TCRAVSKWNAVVVTTTSALKFKEKSIHFRVDFLFVCLHFTRATVKQGESHLHCFKILPFCVSVTRTLRRRAGAKTVRRVHGENRDLELRRSCSVGRSRYSTTNSSILFDKLITNTAEVVLQQMAEMEQMRRCQRCWEDVEENLDIFTCVKSDFERTGPGSPDEIVQTSKGSENKENGGEDVPRRYNLRQSKPADRYQAPMEIRQRDRERTNSGQPHSVRQKESLENAGSQKCRRRARLVYG
uniref:Uncharacterized protein n=1 Tax=Anas platyrhynchos TaxID=8839 RepID=A0A8B9R402_ANAPL